MLKAAARCTKCGLKFTIDCEVEDERPVPKPVPCPECGNGEIEWWTWLAIADDPAFMGGYEIKQT